MIKENSFVHCIHVHKNDIDFTWQLVDRAGAPLVAPYPGIVNPVWHRTWKLPACSRRIVMKSAGCS